MKKKKEDKIIPIEGHRLSTRRDFLGQGLVAGLGYLANGLVDMTLLVSLLVGSLPGIFLGTHVGSLFPDKVMRGILISALLLLGLYFTLLH